MKTSPSKLLFFILFVLIVTQSFATEPPFLKYKKDTWVTTQLEQLSLEEKIAQLMMLTVYPEQNDASKAIYLKRIKQYKPGGILVMQGTPQKTTSWINEFQEASKNPLLVAVDGEWGPAMRIDSTIVYPYAQTLGAIQDSFLIYKMGIDIGKQLKRMGIHMNFAPVADINTNPLNPVIGFRSFGEDKVNVAKKAWMLSKGMQDVGVIPVAKHFPGHGDTKTDSHKTLPLVPHNKTRIDKVESFPFRYLSERGISGIMSGHLNVPSLDATGATSSLSSKIITNYLKKEIGFKGFVVTDAITMKGVKSVSGNAELDAIKAGNDFVEFVPDLGKAINSVKAAIERKEITIEEINEKCRTILALKRWTNLNEYKPADLKKVTSDLNKLQYEVTLRKLIKGSFAVLSNSGILPVQDLENNKIATVSLGGNKISDFQKMLANYTQVDHYILPKSATEQQWTTLRSKLINYNLVIAGVEGIHKYPKGKYGTTEIQRKAVMEIVHENNSVIAFFGNANALKHFSNIQHANGLILAHHDTKLTQQLAAQLVFGAFQADGKLPVTVDQRFKVNSGLTVKANRTFSYTIPEEVGMDSRTLAEIDTIAKCGLEEKAYPGCQVLVAKNGNIIYHKCFGYLTYQNSQPVKKNNIYDWASVTKVTGPLPALMKLVDEKKINLDSRFSNYWTGWKNSNKEKLIFREILAHQARLEPYIAYWMNTVTDKQKLDKKVFHKRPSKKYDVRVSENLYMNHNYKKEMMDTVRNSELLPRKKYTYSGLSFYLYPEIIENLSNTPYEQYLKETFYRPLGAYTLTYNAYKHFPMQRIVPTENDDFFRKENLRGFVHDEGAAMMAGVSGNAGLFGTTNDLAKVFQMYLQKGYFGGRRYISEETMKEFTRIQYPNNENRRGLGFDKPLIDNNENELEDAYPAVSASKQSFGHSGYTGTFAWADPSNGILFIFMSNRVHPTRENTKLYKLNIRTEMHQAIYNSILPHMD